MFPTYREIEVPLLAELKSRGGKARPTDKDSKGRSVYEALADHFNLSKAARDECIIERRVPRSKWENMVRYAVRRLKDNGQLMAPQHGVWQVYTSDKKL